MRLPLSIGFGVAVVLSIAADAASKPTIDSPSDATASLRGKKARPGSAIALAEFKGNTIALVADEDDGMIRIFETKPAKEIGSSKVPGTPSQVLVTKGGKVLVALKDKGQVAILEAKGGDARNLIMKSVIDTGGEPVAISITPDESTLVVASGWTHEIVGYNLADRTQKFRTNVSREPRSIAIASDGSKAYVTHAVGGALTTVDLSSGTATAVTSTATSTSQYSTGPRTRYGTQGFAIAMNDSGKVFAPTVFADPNAQETYYGAGLETLGVSVLDEVNGTIAPSTQNVTAAAYGTLEKCILPRAAAVTADGKRLVVGCAGDTDLIVFDATNSNPRSQIIRTRSSGDSVAAIAIDDNTDSAITWSQHGRMLSVVSLAEKGAKLETASASGGSLSASAGRGRRIFHAVDGRMAADGRACASCHTDGRDDGLTWNTPEGARQTPMLAGRLSDTAPYGWTREAKTFHEYVTGTVTRLRGKGFNTDEMNDLSAYVMTIKAPPKGHGDETAVNKGKEVFAQQGCNTCHAGQSTTDGKRHAIDPMAGTVGASNTSGPFATPSLRFVSETGPYFHDGRYSTLRQLLTSSDKYMGKGRDLPSGDLDALEAYLKTL